MFAGFTRIEERPERVVSRILSPLARVTVICLGPGLPRGSSGRPAPWDGPSQNGARLALLRMGFALPPASPPGR